MSDIEFFLRENKKVKKYSDFPTSPWSPGYVYLSEYAKQLLERILPLDNPSKTAMFEQSIPATTRQRYNSVQTQRNGFTNGLVLNLPTYDTVQAKGQWWSDVDEEDPSQELELSQGFLNTTCSKAAGEDPQTKATKTYTRRRAPNCLKTLNSHSTNQGDAHLQTPQLSSDAILELTKGSTSYIRLRGTASVEDARGKGAAVVGLGSFGSRNGISSKHTAIKRHLVTQVKARGHFAVGAHELYTGVLCPRPLCDNFLETVYPRSKYSRACKIDVTQLERITLQELISLKLRGKRDLQSKPTEESPAPAAKRARR
ncbi:hypothetical protein BX616_009088 [Lobosporangium transversale]|nr:hypothetical protein BX616_009088 [Lobosporangium transversale]